MNTKKKIFAISGSTRKGSSNEKILRRIAALYSGKLDVRIFTEIDKLPHFNPDVATEELDPKVNAFLQQIGQADGVIICTPEYVFSLPGSLKNALEWTVATTVFSNKPAAFIVASASGEKAMESLSLILATLVQSPVPEECQLLIRGGKGKVGADGRLEAAAEADIRMVVDHLVRSIK